MNIGGNRESMILGPDEEECMKADGFRKNYVKLILVWICIAFSGGSLGLLLYWNPSWYAWATSSRSTPEEAELFIIQSRQNQRYVSRVYDMVNVPKYTSYNKVKDEEKLPLIAPDPANKGAFQEVESVKYFECKCVRFIWNPLTKTYEQLVGLVGIPLGYFPAQHGLNNKTRSQRLLLFGQNAIVVDVQSLFVIFIKECLSPFHIFQLFSVILWFFESYTPFAIVVSVLSILSLTFQLFVCRRQQTILRDKLQGSGRVQIENAQGDIRIIDSETLVPGDIFLIDNSIVESVVPCDALLISGYCTANESSLSGQSIPMRKEPITGANAEDILNIAIHRDHLLSAGTQILQATAASDGRTRAIVVRTGFMTGRGELTRDIMFYHTADLIFESQTFWYIFALAVIAVFGMIYTIILKVQDGSLPPDIIMRTGDLITIIIPPVLPIALTFGIIFSQFRLRHHHVGCPRPSAINLCGLIDLCCFDKTGTLTVDGLDLKCMLPVNINNGRAEFQNPNERRYSYCDIRQPIVRAVAACHSLSNSPGKEDKSKNKRPVMPFLLGDPLEIVMFKSIHWRLAEQYIPAFGNTKFKIAYPGVDVINNILHEKKSHERGTSELVILREFPFTETLQRMGVIAYNTATDQREYYQKGAPEIMVNFCDPATIPVDFADRLNQLLFQGYRVIAIAWKMLNDINIVTLSKMARADAEKDLEFVGLVAFENRIKEDSSAVIEKLYQANIRTVMLTGDNIHTAISVARACGMIRSNERISVVEADEENVKFRPRMKMLANGNLKINGTLTTLGDDEPVETESVLTTTSLALTGATLRTIKKFHPTLLPKILLQGTVFARMTPIDKEYMVNQFQRVQYKVAMCGDGANDCQALRAAHAGISLADSVSAAAADFISTKRGIACVPTVLREGRCALLTYIGTFFFMETYSMCQFTNCILLYWVGTTLTDWQFLYQDLFEATVLVIVVAWAIPYTELSRGHTPSTLKSFPAIFGLIGHTVIILIAQIIAYATALNITCPADATATDNLTLFFNHSTNVTDRTRGELSCGMEDYGVWSVGILQILFLSFIFTKGPPFRQPFYTNYPYMFCAVVLITFDLVCILRPTQNLLDKFQMSIPLMDYMPYRWAFVFISIGYFLLAFGFEKFMVGKYVGNCLLRHKKLRCLRAMQRKDVEYDLWKMVQSIHTSSPVTFQNQVFSQEEHHSVIK